MSELNHIWKQRLLILAAAIAFLCLAFYSTIDSMVQTWLRSETFTHGFLILPISLYLIWQLKKPLSTTEPVTQVWALPLIAITSFGWLMASLVDVLVVQQWAFVTLLLLMVLLLLGWSVVKQILFPLLYLYFMVPFGEQFITPMMHMTAGFVISAIELTGIPIYSEGTFFTLPSGSWSVVEGCSGVRYLIASLALGTLYSYMTYTSYVKRSVFILAAIIFPIIANWLRAFMIVMLGHFSGMKLATGVDHIIYGWVFFGIVLFIMFWVGSYWRDNEPEHRMNDVTTLQQENTGRFLVTTLAGLLILALAPFMDYKIKQNALQSAEGDFAITLSAAPHWTKSETTAFQWTPQYINPSAHYQAEYTKNNEIRGIYLALYRVQKQGSELISSQNVMVRQKHPVWKQLREETQHIMIEGQPETVWETHLSSEKADLLIWHWNVIAGDIIINSYQAKLLEALNKLSGNNQGEYAVVVYTQLHEQGLAKARVKLQQFVDANTPGIFTTSTNNL